MFKLVKILNRGVNVAEPCLVNAQKDTAYAYGSAAVLKDGALAPAGQTEKPTYIVGENLKANEKATVLAYPINSDMIFETKVSESPLSLKCGDPVTLSITEGMAMGVSATTEGGVCEIYDLADAKDAGDTVFVKFN